MSVKTASGASLNRTSGLGTTEKFTVCGWSRLNSYTSYDTFINVYSNDAGSKIMQMIESGGAYYPSIYNSLTSGEVVTPIRPGLWFFWSLQAGPVPDAIADGFSITDNFNRASLGDGWTSVNGTWSIESSTILTPNVGASEKCVFRNDNSFGNDQAAACAISNLSTGNIIGPAVRCSASGYIGFYASSGAWWLFYSNGNGSDYNEIATAARSFGNGDTLRLEITGDPSGTSLCRLFHNGSEIGTGYTTTCSYKGQPGVAAFPSASDTAKADDWYGYGVSALTGKVAVLGGRDFETKRLTLGSYATITDFEIGNDGADEFFNGPISNVKFWSGVVLTEDELRREMRSFIPKRRQGLSAWYPLRNGGRDWSGNGNDLTVNGSPTWPSTEPPIPWDADALDLRTARDISRAGKWPGWTPYPALYPPGCPGIVIRPDKPRLPGTTINPAHPLLRAARKVVLTASPQRDRLIDLCGQSTILGKSTGITAGASPWGPALALAGTYLDPSIGGGSIVFADTMTFFALVKPATMGYKGGLSVIWGGSSGCLGLTTMNTGGGSFALCSTLDATSGTIIAETAGGSGVGGVWWAVAGCAVNNSTASLIRAKPFGYSSAAIIKESSTASLNNTSTATAPQLSDTFDGHGGVSKVYAIVGWSLQASTATELEMFVNDPMGLLLEHPTSRLFHVPRVQPWYDHEGVAPWSSLWRPARI